MGYKFEKYSIGGGGSGVGEYINMECYYKWGESADNYYTVEALFSAGGFAPVITYHVVNALPENPNVTDLTTGNPTHIYFYNDVPYLYGNAGYGNMWMGLTDVLASFDFVTTAKGFTSDITNETEDGVYVTYQTVSKETIDGLNTKIDWISERLNTTTNDVVMMVQTVGTEIDLSKYDNITTVQGGFAFNESVETVILPKNLQLIGGDAFNGCSNLKNITIPESVTSIGVRAFQACHDIESITIPDSVTSIGFSAFSDCSNLKNITIPESVTRIGRYAFANCYGITIITLPFLGETKNGTENTNFGYIFSGNSNVPETLKTVVITSATSIDSGAFDSCSNIESITIPESVTSIGLRAFQYCASLANIVYNGTKAQWKEITKGTAWDNGTGNYTIYCTDGTIAKDGTET